MDETDNSATNDDLSPQHREMLSRIADHLEAYLREGKHPLRPKQIEVFKDIIAGARRGEWGGFVKRPTGTGKTVIFSAIVQALQALSYELERPGQEFGCLILVPTTLLADQTYRTMIHDLRKDGTPMFGMEEEDVAILKSDDTPSKKGEALAAPNLIMTYDYFHSLSKRDQVELTSRFFTILDEADLAKGEKRTPLFDEWIDNHYTLGFSATDKFIGENGLTSIRKELFHGRPALHETQLKQAAEDGEIAPTRNVLFVTNLESGVERKARGKDREFTEKEAQAIVDQPGRDDAAIRSIAEFKDPNTGIEFKNLDQVWFCMGVKHAERIAARLNEIYAETQPDGSPRYPYGYAVAVSGTTPKEDWVDDKGKERLGLTSILEKHRTGEIPVLCNADILIRGFDSPRTQLCVMLRPTKSPALVEQAGGRVARLDPANENKMAYVASFFDKDTESALCFTDVAGASYIGPEGDEKRADYKASNTETRSPDMEALRRDQSVEVKTYFEPRDIESFLSEARVPRKGSPRTSYEQLPKTHLPFTEMIAPICSSESVSNGLERHFRRIYEQAVDENQDHITMIGQRIPIEDIGIYKHQGKTVLGILENHKNLFTQEHLKIMPHGFVVSKDARKQSTIEALNFFKAAEEALETQKQKNDGLVPATIEVQFDGAIVNIPTSLAGSYRLQSEGTAWVREYDSRKPVFAMHESLMEPLRELLLKKKGLSATGMYEHFKELSNPNSLRAGSSYALNQIYKNAQYAQAVYNYYSTKYPIIPKDITIVFRDKPFSLPAEWMHGNKPVRIDPAAAPVLSENSNVYREHIYEDEYTLTYIQGRFGGLNTYYMNGRLENAYDSLMIMHAVKSDFARANGLPPPTLPETIPVDLHDRSIRMPLAYIAGYRNVANGSQLCLKKSVNGISVEEAVGKELREQRPLGASLSDDLPADDALYELVGKLTRHVDWTHLAPKPAPHVKPTQAELAQSGTKIEASPEIDECALDTSIPESHIDASTSEHQGSHPLAEYLVEKISRMADSTVDGFVTRLHKSRHGRAFTSEQVSEWTSGKSTPSDAEVEKLVDALNLPLQERLVVFRAAAASRS